MGTLGRSLRAFTPIYDTENNREIGFVSAGTLTNSIEKAKNTAIKNIILISFGGLTGGIIGAFLLANNIKSTLLGLEPEEITKLYSERMGILGAIHEGLVVQLEKYEKAIQFISDISKVKSNISNDKY